MYDIDELERKWIKYKRRKIAVYISVAVLGLSITGGAVYLVAYLKNKKDNVGRVSQHNSMPNIEKDKDIIVKRSEKKIQNMQTEVPSMHNKQTSVVDENIEQPKVLTNNNDNSNLNYKKPKKINLIIRDPQNENIVKEIENRFAQSKSYNDAIYLAEYYYSRNNYKKAEYWAMQANIINSLPEESWLIFAKSKVKSGHRVEALKVLQAYYDKTGSTNVLELIDLIRKNGKF